ncbi:RNA methyltransferase [Candidatus Fermentibacterales bacterium]|nr:RNA methyltransferase [Candidatus Fermentibacterales bacterium]
MLLEGPRFLEDCLGSPCRSMIDFVLVSSAPSRKAGEVARLALGSEVPTFELSPELLEGISQTQHSQGIVAVCRTPDVPGSAIEAACFVLALDAVADPGNVGTIIRSAAAFGIDVVVMGKGSACPFTPKVTRASAGANLLVPLIEKVDLASFLAGCRERGLSLVGASARAESHGRDLPEPPLVLVAGSEPGGLSAGVSSMLDRFVPVEMRPGIDSLNVAVSASILMHDIARSCGRIPGDASTGKGASR